MATHGSKQSQVSTSPPPRTLNVQKFSESRAAELEALHSIIMTRLNSDFRTKRNKRRRTTGYDNRIAKSRHRKKQKLALADMSFDIPAVKVKKNPPRHIRRRIELRKNPETGFSTSGDGTKRLRTHLWHAKRFTMTKIWGFHLPLGLQGRARGSRSLLRGLKHEVLIHDASYYGALQLEGPENLLLSILSTVLVPSPSTHPDDLSHAVLSGACYGKAMLHHIGAPFSRPIAPVTYVWQPSNQSHIGVDIESHDFNGHDEPPRVDGCSPLRRLWVWMHSAGFTEGHEALKFACQKQMDETGITITCISREGQLAKLEVMGSRAFHLLQMILHPVTCISENSWKLRSAVESDGETGPKNPFILDNEDHISSSAVISLIVIDPRSLPDKKVVVIPEATRTCMQKNEVEGHLAMAGNLNRSSDEERCDLSDYTSLWDSSKGLRPPVGESVLCLQKHQQRLDFFSLSNTDLGAQNVSTAGQTSRLCPIMLLKNNSRKGSTARWSVILPLSWVKVFWILFVSNGAHAIGLREKHWIACEAGLLYFPSDFPDCEAYSCFMANEALTNDQKAKLRPPAMRPIEVPIPPPWNSVHFAQDENSARVGDAQIPSGELCAKNTVNSNSVTDSDCAKHDTVASGLHVVSFKGFVVRASFMLSEFLSSINGNHLPLFPKMANRKVSISEFMKDHQNLNWGGSGAISLINYDKKLCFLRVLLHAHKKGVFDEGAMVCAPHFTDVMSCVSRCENNDTVLQMPQSSLTSFFVRQPSGAWEIQIPDTPVSRESYRWPIGYVTAGFVRGSKKPVAGAICEAVSLARIREDQWNSIPAKQRRKEIFVLVRNLRSTAYRLALATIVLEHQEEDVECI